MTRDEAVAEIRSVPRTCRGPLPQEKRDVVKALLEKGRSEDAKIVDAVYREGCGADFNELVNIPGPWDGQEHPYTCPKCGVTGTYTAPLYEIEA